MIKFVIVFERLDFLMLSNEAITNQALNELDLGFFKSIFISGTDYFAAQSNFALVFILFLIIWVVLGFIFNRDNWGSYYRFDVSFWKSLIISGAVSYGVLILIQKTTDFQEMNRALGPIVAKIKADTIEKEQNLRDKLEYIVAYTDKSGKIYYLLDPLEEENWKYAHEGNDEDTLSDTKSKEEIKKTALKQEHIYLSIKNYQADYVSGIKQLEDEYKNNNDLETAKYLAEVFKKGNQFIYANMKKSAHYSSIVKKAEKEAQEKIKEREKALEVKEIPKAKV